MFITRFLFKKFAPRPREDGLKYGSNLQRYFSILADLLIFILLAKMIEPIFLSMLSLSEDVFDALHKNNMKLTLTPEEMSVVQNFQFRYFFMQLGSLVAVSSCLIASWYYFSASIGQILFGLRIANDVDGSRLTFAQVIKRFFAGFATVATLMIGFLYSIFDKKRQSLHDKIAKTIVVTKKSLKQQNLYNPRYDIFDEVVFPFMKSAFEFLKAKFYSLKEKVARNR